MLDKIKKMFKFNEQTTQTVPINEEEQINTSAEDTTIETTLEIPTVPVVENLETVPGALDYLDTAPEVIGYESIQDQYAVYDTISNFISTNSIVDFGCGRGDFYMYRKSSTGKDVDYVGVDLNPNLIASGNRMYKDTNIVLKNISWFDPSFTDVRDWSISVTSLTTRYDSSMISDEEYLLKSIDSMMDHCNIGSVLLLTSKYMPDSVRETLDYMQHDPGSLMNKLIEKYGRVSIDHSFHESTFILYILK